MDENIPNKELLATIAKNYQIVQERIVASCYRANRSPQEVMLIVVTKGHNIERIRCVIELGLRKFGENYAEEGVEKIQKIGQLPRLEWHMIGHIQSRKAEMVAQYYDFVHSIDSLKLARRLNQFAEARKKKLPVLLECNISGEETKFGFPAADKAKWDDLAEIFSEIALYPNLDVRGLMTMAPFYQNAEDARPVFKKLVELQNYLRSWVPKGTWRELSMGMSSDFEIAIEEGATMVRIGQAILGERVHT